MSEHAHIPERRAYPRRRIAISAFIEDRHCDYFTCQIIDFASKGARIEAKDLALPDTFVLMLKLSNTVRRRCRVVWRDGFVAGLQFTAWPAGLNKETVPAVGGRTCES